MSARTRTRGVPQDLCRTRKIQANAKCDDDDDGYGGDCDATAAPCVVYGRPVCVSVYVSLDMSAAPPPPCLLVRNIRLGVSVYVADRRQIDCSYFN